MAKEVFLCEASQNLFKKKSEKGLYLEVSDTMITGKGIIYLENRRNEYIGDINYEIKTITRVEQTVYQKMDTFVIYVRASSLYGVEKVQIRLPGMRDASRAADMLRRLMEENKDVVNSVTRSMVIPEPIQRAEFPANPAAAGTPGAATGTIPPVTPGAATGIIPPVTPIAPSTPASAPVSASAAEEPAPVLSMEEYQNKLARLESIYQTGIMTEKEYKTSKAEYISAMNGLAPFFSKVKVNLQYSEIGFLSEAEFTEFKTSTVTECSNLKGVPDDIMKQNLKKLLILNLCEILTDEEYKKICMDIVSSVQYSTTDPENVVIEKIEKWPVLKDSDIITEAQYNHYLNLVAEDTKIKMSDSIPILEHKLMRLTTLSKTFIFTADEFEKKKEEFVNDMTAFDYSSEPKLREQLERVITLKRFNWLSETTYQTKKDVMIHTIGKQFDTVKQMQLYGIIADVGFITKAEYDGFKQKVIDEIFQHYSDVSELQKKAKSLMSLKEAGIISEAEFNEFKKKLLTL